MDHNNLMNSYKNIFNKNLFLRFLSAMVLIPLFIFSLLLSGWIIILFYIVILTIINLELQYIFIKSNNKYIVLFYFILANISILFLPIYFFSNDNHVLSFLYIIFSVWIFDTFSFFGGTFLKGKKIFPKISKGKTYSGMISGFFALMIFNTIISYFFEYFTFYNIYYSFLIGLGSFIGDAVVSIIKRTAKLKDTGNLLPGHGGILDRMDSFIFVFFIIIIFNLI